jgi:lipopolysaccharide biosynthesis glycosyltransferase
MNIVICGNAKAIEKSRITLYSLLKNNKVKNVYVISTETIDIKYISSLCFKFRTSFNFMFVNPKELDVFSFKSSGWQSTVTVETYLRLLIPSLIAQKKVIYLDTDVIVDSDISELWDFDLDGNALGMTIDGSSGETSDSFQAGVMLIDLDKLREIDFTKKCIEYVSSCIKEKNFVENYDQGTINYICKGMIKEVPWYYNFNAWTFGRAFPTRSGVLVIDNPRYINRRLGPEFLSQVKVFHYAGFNKGWDFENSKYFYYKNLLESDN